MNIKVCGIKHQENLDVVAAAGIDMVGFNFYPASKRFVMDELTLKSTDIKKVGVFVNASYDYIKRKQEEYQLDYLQLHGDETIADVKVCKKLCKVIKVFRISENFDYSTVQAFEEADLFLFDTYTPAYGGSGKRFDWKKLIQYKGKTPFLLAGGIGPLDVDLLKRISHSKLYGVDINSCFETAPGKKNPEEVKTFVKNLNDNT